MGVGEVKDRKKGIPFDLGSREGRERELYGLPPGAKAF